MIAATLLVAAVACPGPVAPQSALAQLQRAVAANPGDVQSHVKLADVYLTVGCPLEAAAELRTATTLTPRDPSVWYALGQAYNTVKGRALASFTNAADAPWRALISADALLENNHPTDAFAIYRATLEALPSMITIHDSIARIYEHAGHAEWAAIERRRIPSGDVCEARRAMCEFRARRYESALDEATQASDAESRYWTARSANELALTAFRHLDDLPDSIERRAVRAAVAQAQERYLDAVAEYKAAVQLSPRPELQYQLASAYYSARDYDLALATLSPLLQQYPDEARLLGLKAQTLLQLQRADEALPLLKDLVRRRPDDQRLSLALGRAYLQTSNFKDAIPLFEQQLDNDTDGSLHMQLARAYVATGQRDKATPLMSRSEELRKADDERRAAQLRREITGPK